MKWKNHKLLTGSLFFALSGDVILTAGAVIGSILPDVIEKIPYLFGYRRKNHRQLSHWFVPYLLSGMGFYQWGHYLGIDDIKNNLLDFILSQDMPSPEWNALILYWLTGVFGGACLHIAQDALCGTVPSIFPKRRIGKLFFNVGSAQEYIIAILGSVFFLIPAIKKFFEGNL